MKGDIKMVWSQSKKRNGLTVDACSPLSHQH